MVLRTTPKAATSETTGAVVAEAKVSKKSFEAPDAGDLDTSVVEQGAGGVTDVEVIEGVAVNVGPVVDEPTAKVIGPVSEADAKAETSGAKAEVKEDPQADLKASVQTAVAIKKASALTSTLSKKFQPALVDFENVIDPAILDFNTFVRVTVSLDGFEDSEGNDLGKEVRMQLMSYNSRWVVSPGVQDAEATEMVRYSVDGKTIDGTDGESIHDYLKMLKEVENYDKASIKEYLAIYGFMTHASAQEGKELVFGEIPPEDRQIIELQVPPQSRTLFTRFQIESGVKIAQKIIEATDVLVCRQDKVDGKTAKYAQIKFASK